MSKNSANYPESSTTRNPIRRVWHWLTVNAVGLFRNPGIQFLRDLFGLFSAQVLVKLIGFAIFAYLARILTQEGYGAVEFSASVAGLGLLVVDFGLGNIGVRERLRGETDDALVAEIGVLRLIMSCLVLPVALVTVFLSFEDSTIRLLGTLYALTLILNAWKQEWLLQSLEKIGQIAFGQVLRAFSFAAIVILLVVGPDNVVWVGGAELGSTAIWIGYLLIQQKRAGIRWGLSLNRERARYLIGKAAPLGGTSMIWGMVQFVPPIAVAVFAGLEAAALLAVAQRIVTSLQTISYIYHFNLYTALIQRYEESAAALEKLARASIRVIAWGFVGPAVLCALYASDVLALVFGQTYYAAGPVLAILIFAVPVHILSGHQRWTLTAMGRTRSVLAAAVLGVVTTLVGVAILTPLFGAVGAAAATVTATVVIWIASTTLCRRQGVWLPPWVGLTRPVLLALAVYIFTNSIVDIWWLWQLAVELVLYSLLSFIVDWRVLPDLRHLAYAKNGVNGPVDGTIEDH